jgi:hypothetical protein
VADLFDNRSVIGNSLFAHKKQNPCEWATLFLNDFFKDPLVYWHCATIGLAGAREKSKQLDALAGKPGPER